MQCVVAEMQGKPCRLSPSLINSVLEILAFHLPMLCKHVSANLVLCRGVCLTKHQFLYTASDWELWGVVFYLHRGMALKTG